MKRVLFLFIALLASLAGATAARASTDLDKPPADLAPSNATVSSVLKTYRSALGTRDPHAAPVTIEDWSYTESGTSGTEHLVRRGDDYHAHITYGPLAEDFGMIAGKQWHHDYNGVSSVMKSGDDTSFNMLVLMRLLDDLTDPKYDLKVAGEVQSPKPSYVLPVSYTGSKHPEWFYVDKASGLIDEVSFVDDDERMTLTFDDYRNTAGLMRPCHIHATNGDPSLETDFVRTSFAAAKSAPPNEFLPPPSTHNFVQFGGPAWLPTRLIRRIAFLPIGNGGSFMFATVPQLVIPLTVDGRRLDFAISSGLARSIIDSGVARELGLPTFGHATHARDGDVSYETVLKSASIGSLTINNMAFRAEPFFYNPQADTKIVGVLGADVLSAALFKIDFTNGSMLLMPPNAYNGGPPVKDAIDLPIDMDDGRPFANVAISNRMSANMLIDNDMDFSATFGSYTESLPGWVDRAGKKGATSVIPFADNKSFGKEFAFWSGVFNDISFGSMDFQNLEIVGTDYPLAWGSRDIDFVLGIDILRYYDVYLDYQHQRVYLKPNQAFQQRFGR